MGFLINPFGTFAAGGGGTAPSIVDASYTSNTASNSASVTIPGYAYGSGSNRKVICVAGMATTTGSDTLSATYGGVSMEQVIARQVNTFEKIYMWQILESSLPGGGSGDVVVTCSANTYDLGALTFTVKDVEQVALASMDTPQGRVSSTSDDITPSAANSLVIGAAQNSASSAGSTWIAGLTAQGSPLVYAGTATLLIGQATQGNSLLTCSNDFSGGRSSIILASFQPA